MFVIASQNPHKISEVSELAQSFGLEPKPVYDFEGCPDVEEDGTTFDENAAIKAVKYSIWLKREHGIWPPVVAEDAGLEIEALMGWPGVYSARIAETNEERMAMIMDRLEESMIRTARFVACTAMAINGHLVHEWVGVASGKIADTPTGTGGFGYDPIFFDPVLGCTYAQVSSSEKSTRSHRAKAWSKSMKYLVARQHLLT